MRHARHPILLLAALAAACTLNPEDLLESADLRVDVHNVAPCADTLKLEVSATDAGFHVREVPLHGQDSITVYLTDLDGGHWTARAETRLGGDVLQRASQDLDHSGDQTQVRLDLPDEPAGACGGDADTDTDTDADTDVDTDSDTDADTCEAKTHVLAQRMIDGGSRCTVVVRLDHDTYSLLGYQVFCGPGTDVDQETALETARRDAGFSFQVWEDLSNGAPEVGEFVFYHFPSDEGGVAVVSMYTGLTVFGASIWWDGIGDITYPTEWRDASELGAGCTQAGYFDPWSGYDLTRPEELGEEQAQAAIAAAFSTVIPEAASRYGEDGEVVVLRYPRTIGGFDSTTAEWIVFYNQMYLPGGDADTDVDADTDTDTLVPDCSGAAGLQAGSPWPMYQGCPNHPGRSPATGPSAPVERWRFDSTIPMDWFHGAIALGADGTIYVGSADSHGYALGNLYALAPDGTERWRVELEGVQAPPAIGADGTIYVNSYEKLHALDADGSERWSFRVDGYVDHAPAVWTDGTVYVASSRLYAVDPDGSERWSFALDRSARSAPAVGKDGTIYVVGEVLHAVDPDGTERWSFTGSNLASSATIAADGTIYVAGDELHALEADGTERWSFQHGDRVTTCPALGADGIVYIATKDSDLYAVNPDGTRQWVYMTFERYTRHAPVVDAGGTIYISASQSESLYAVTPDGKLRWRIDGRGSPALDADGVLYVGAGPSFVAYADPL